MRVLSVFVFILGTACLFQTQAKYLRPCRQGAKLPLLARGPYLHPCRQRCAWPLPAKRSTNSRRFRRRAKDENGRAMNRHLQVSWVSKRLILKTVPTQVHEHRLVAAPDVDEYDHRWKQRLIVHLEHRLWRK